MKIITCKKCHEEKEAYNGRVCRECTLKIRKDYYYANQEEMKENSRITQIAYRENNREKARLAVRKACDKNVLADQGRRL